MCVLYLLYNVCLYPETANARPQYTYMLPVKVKTKNDKTPVNTKSVKNDTQNKGKKLHCHVRQIRKAGDDAACK